MGGGCRGGASGRAAEAESQEGLQRRSRKKGCRGGVAENGSAHIEEFEKYLQNRSWRTLEGSDDHPAHPQLHVTRDDAIYRESSGMYVRTEYLVGVII